MELGSQTQEVTVSGSAAQLQTDKSDVHTELNPHEMANLPLPNYRNFQSLINLVPGATPAQFTNSITDTPQRSLSTNVNGTTSWDRTDYFESAPRENLELFARLEGVPDPTASAADLLARFSLPGDARPSADLSVGNRQRLNVALSLLGEPRVLLLDEPTAALDPGQRRRVWEVVNALRSDGGAVCFATQNLEEVEHADRVLVLLDGRVVPSSPEEVFR